MARPTWPLLRRPGRVGLRRSQAVAATPVRWRRHRSSWRPAGRPRRAPRRHRLRTLPAQRPSPRSQPRRARRPHVGNRGRLLRCVCSRLGGRCRRRPCGRAGVTAATSYRIADRHVAGREGSRLHERVVNSRIAWHGGRVDRQHLLRAIGRPRGKQLAILDGQCLRRSRHLADGTRAKRRHAQVRPRCPRGATRGERRGSPLLGVREPPPLPTLDASATAGCRR